GPPGGPPGILGENPMKVDRRTFMAAAAASAAMPVFAGMPARAAAPQIGKQVPSIYRYKLGEFEITVFSDGAIKAPKPETVVVNQRFEQVQKALEAAHLPKDQITNVFTPFVVNTGKNLVLFDAGFNDNGPPSVGALAANLVTAGIDPKAIDTVIISHFH